MLVVDGDHAGTELNADGEVCRRSTHFTTDAPWARLRDVVGGLQGDSERHGGCGTMDGLEGMDDTSKVSDSTMVVYFATFCEVKGTDIQRKFLLLNIFLNVL